MLVEPGTVVLFGRVVVGETASLPLRVRNVGTGPLLVIAARDGKLSCVRVLLDAGADVHAAAKRIVRNHVTFTPPIVLDARMKPGFPEELFADEATAATVTRRWKEYFPSGVAMGDAAQGHLD